MTAFPALRSFLDCSTAHLSPAARDHLDMVAASRSEMVAATPYGWFLWAGQDGVDDRMPDTLTAILAYARTLAADYVLFDADAPLSRSEEHTSELQSPMRISYAVHCLKKHNHT